MLAEAVQSLGFQVGDVNDENFEGEGFWNTLPLSLRNGARRGTYRESIQMNLQLCCHLSEIETYYANIFHINVCTDDMQFK